MNWGLFKYENFCLPPELLFSSVNCRLSSGGLVSRVISTDTHIVEPPDIYANGMPTHLVDSTKYAKVTNDDGKVSDAWFLGDQQVVTLGAVTQAGRRFEDPAELDFVEVWEDVREGAYKPDAMLEELEMDGVWGAVVQPSQGLFWYHIEDSEILSGICHV